jgi:hypothetical protein
MIRIKDPKARRKQGCGSDISPGEATRGCLPEVSVPFYIDSFGAGQEGERNPNGTERLLCSPSFRADLCLRASVPRLWRHASVSRAPLPAVEVLGLLPREREGERTFSVYGWRYGQAVESQAGG